MNSYFNFENTPKRYLDVETGEHIDLYSDNIKEAYRERSGRSYIADIKLKCAQYRIKYVDVDIQVRFLNSLEHFYDERQKFL